MSNPTELPDMEAERILFEADTAETFAAATFGRFPVGGNYNVTWVQEQWNGWQRAIRACRSQPEGEAPQAEIASFEKTLRQSQVSMDPEIATLLHESLWDLYESNDEKSPLCGAQHAESGVGVFVEREAVWIKSGVQSFKLAYEADTDVERQWYAGMLRKALAAQQVAGPGTPEAPKPPFPISDDEMAALRRFWECATDGEGYDVEKPMMQRLAEMGLVQRKSGAYYMSTEFGLYMLGEYTTQLDGGQEGSDHA